MQEIVNYIREDLIVELEGTDKTSALRQIMDAFERDHILPDPDAFFKKILDREKQSSTGLGLGVAIPHARIESLDKIVIAVGRSLKGIDFVTPDGTPVHLIFMIAINSQQAEYLKILSRISWLVRNDEFRERLFNCPTSADVYRLLKEHN
jgi:fructose-specific phosphotransferase system IIA component